MGKIKYEKHQREYTLLSTTLIIEYLFSDDAKIYFSNEAVPLYVFIKDRVLYHFAAVSDYHGWGEAWNENFGIPELTKMRNDEKGNLLEFRNFLKAKHSNPIEAIKKLHWYMIEFMPIILISAYVPTYGKNVSEEALELLLDIRNDYEDVSKIGMSFEKEMLGEIEEEMGLEKDTLTFLTINEFREFVKSKKAPNDLKERKKFLLIKQGRDDIKFFSKNEAEEELKKIDEMHGKKIEVDEFKGTPARGGHVKGKVRLIRLIEEAQNLKEGEILVTAMTDPRYVQAMKKAGAIVTDEGGITCHAAIVARELGKPCIIGTKIATSALKDGDEVEVDADQGVVTIIKKK